MKRTRWTMRRVGGLVFAAAAVGGGCKQPLVMEPGDYHNSVANAGVLGMRESDQNRPIPPGPIPDGVAPATPVDPSLPARPIALKECMAIAIEQGNVGGSAQQPGITSDGLPQFQGRGTTGTDSIRAFAVDPAIATAEVERSLSKFDARLISSVTWNQVDQPVSNFTANFQNGDRANVTTTIAKPLPTGGVAGITFSTDYQKLSNPPTNNQFSVLAQSYTPRLQFVLEQPLLQAFGVEINQLLPNHPGSFLIPGFRTTGQGTEGILITRLRQDQQRAQFDVLVNQMLVNVEAAYWNLYASYFTLSAQEEGLKQAFDAYDFLRKRQVGGIARDQLVYQTEAQYHQFRGQVVNARNDVLTRERQLRGLLGLRSDAGDRLVPVDEPVLAPFKADLRGLFAEGREFRPELLIIRQELKARQLDLLTQRNLRRPDVRLLTSYDIAGIGRRLDGAETVGGTTQDNAFRSLANNDFNNWQVGIRADIPLGFRDANALVRQAQLNLKRAFIQSYDTERKLDEVLVQRYRDMERSYVLIETSRSARLASENQIRRDLKIRDEGAIGGQGSDATSFILNLLQAQQNLAAQTASEFQNIALYNVALAQIEYEKGTIQRYNNVSVADGPLPAHVQKKAADHFAAREAAVRLREKPADDRFGPLDTRQHLTDAQMPAKPGQPGALAVPPPTSLGTGSLPYAPPLTGPARETAPTPNPVVAPPGNPMPPLTPTAPAPLPLNPAPLPLAPARPPLGAGAGVPQLQPADTPGTFSPTGTVSLPPARDPRPAAPDSGAPVSVPR